MATKKKILYTTGVTTEGVLILSGCFKLYDTHGIPIPIIVGILADKNCMMNWIDFCENAVKHGWTLQATIVKLREAVGDVYPRDWVQDWENHIKLYKINKEEK